MYTMHLRLSSSWLVLAFSVLAYSILATCTTFFVLVFSILANCTYVSHSRVLYLPFPYLCFPRPILLISVLAFSAPPFIRQVTAEKNSSNKKRKT